MKELLSTVATALLRAVADLLNPRLWLRLLRELASADGAVVLASVAVTSWMAHRTVSAPASAWAGNLGLAAFAGVVAYPSMLRLFSRIGARFVAAEHPGLLERRQPGWWEMLWLFLPTGILYLVIAIPAVLFLPVGGLAVALLAASFLFDGPLFRLATALYLAPDEAARLRAGEWQGQPAAGAGSIGMLGTGLVLGAEVVFTIALGKASALVTMPQVMTTWPPALPASFGWLVAATILLQLLYGCAALARVYLPRVAKLMAEQPPGPPAALHEAFPPTQPLPRPGPVVARASVPVKPPPAWQLRLAGCPAAVVVASVVALGWGLLQGGVLAQLLQGATFRGTTWQLLPFLAPIPLLLSALLMPLGWRWARALYLVTGCALLLHPLLAARSLPLVVGAVYLLTVLLLLRGSGAAFFRKTGAPASPATVPPRPGTPRPAP